MVQFEFYRFKIEARYAVFDSINLTCERLHIDGGVKTHGKFTLNMPPPHPKSQRTMNKSKPADGSLQNTPADPPKGHVAFDLIKRKLKQSDPRRGRRDLDGAQGAWDRLAQLKGPDREDWSNKDLKDVVEEANTLSGVLFFSLATLRAEISPLKATASDARQACLDYLDQPIHTAKQSHDTVAYCKALEAKARFHECEEDWASLTPVLAKLWKEQRDNFREPVEAVRTGCRWVYSLIRQEQILEAASAQKQVEMLVREALPRKRVLRTVLDVYLNKALLYQSRRQNETTADVRLRCRNAERILRKCRILLREVQLSTDEQWYGPLQAAISVRLGVALKNQGKLKEAYEELLSGLTKRVELGTRSGLGRGLPHLAQVYFGKARSAFNQGGADEGKRLLKCASWLYAVANQCLAIKGKKRSRASALVARARVFKCLHELSGEDGYEQREELRRISSDPSDFFEEEARQLVSGLSELIDLEGVNKNQWVYIRIANALLDEAAKVARDAHCVDILEQIVTLRSEMNTQG